MMWHDVSSLFVLAIFFFVNGLGGESIALGQAKGELPGPARQLERNLSQLQANHQVTGGRGK
jgi:hypothetical protein